MVHCSVSSAHAFAFSLAPSHIMGLEEVILWKSDKLLMRPEKLDYIHFSLYHTHIESGIIIRCGKAEKQESIRVCDNTINKSFEAIHP